ncbi:hypothetical protein FRC10_008777 [Ceratobasidium sp. 414]|nr:hypothetical protein FRC10_008777 [Ceratobasidium sp. 414]
MGPVFLIASAVYMGLKLAQAQLSHEKFVVDAKARIATLEQELESLRSAKLVPTSPNVGGGGGGSGDDGRSARSWYTLWK